MANSRLLYLSEVLRQIEANPTSEEGMYSVPNRTGKLREGGHMG